MVKLLSHSGGLVGILFPDNGVASPILLLSLHLCYGDCSQLQDNIFSLGYVRKMAL